MPADRFRRHSPSRRRFRWTIGRDIGGDQDACAARLAVDQLEIDAERLEFEDAAFATVVFSLALCSVPDDRAAVREAKRVLRLGGRLVLIEHVRSPRRWVRAGELLVNLFTSHLQGDYMLREPLRHLRDEGFDIEELERSKLGIIERATARKPWR